VNILIVSRVRIPVVAYGGTERVIWDLGAQLTLLGHRVRYLVRPGSSCPFAETLPLVDEADWRALVPPDTDVVHLQFHPGAEPDFPHVVTEHGNPEPGARLLRNTVFVSRNQAMRHGAQCFVHNGLDWSAYGAPSLDQHRNPRFHFLGKAAWRVKNVQGAIDVAREAGVSLDVLGGKRLNLKRGFRFTLSPRVRFHGMVGGTEKNRLLNASAGLILPVRWHEPFGLAVIESLYFGCPVFATPYGAFPEIVPPSCGVLSARQSDLADAVKKSGRFDRRACHQHAMEHFSARRMAAEYLRCYERVAAGERLNDSVPVLAEDARGLPWSP
jgi:glycosyltransferase involved in cell wall biosynthesis